MHSNIALALSATLATIATSSLAADPATRPLGAPSVPGASVDVEGAPPPDDVPGRARWGVDLELDPTAYVLGGYSFHAGLGGDQLRVDLGVFAMDVPEAIHGNAGIDAHFDGFGAKLQWFPWALRSGGFFGVDVGLAELELEAADGARAEQTQLSLGVNAGWRFDLPWNLYATPWLGVAYNVGAQDVSVGDARFDSMRWTIFPAVHLGYRFD